MRNYEVPCSLKIEQGAAQWYVFPCSLELTDRWKRKASAQLFARTQTPAYRYSDMIS